MKRQILVLVALLCAACSSDPEGTPTPPSTNSGLSDAGIDQGSTTPDPDASSTSDLPDLTAVGDVGTGEPDATTEPDAATPVDMDEPNPGGIYVGTSDPYLPGALQVAMTTVAADDGPGVDTMIFAPSAAGRYPVVVFQHGFSLRNRYFSTLLNHVASHGFVVVAPQMYEPSFFNAPTAAEEAVAARTLYDWVIASIDGAVAVDAEPTRLGLAGHSRGAKVVWLALEAGFNGATAAVGVDPVDGTGGPLGGEARVLAGGLAANLPSLFIGAELSAQPVFGQVCAPAGDDHAAFYAAASSPAYWSFAEDYGHLDMLDDNPTGCGITCSACAEGPADGGMRRFVGGQLVAFFRWQLQGDAGAEALIDDAAAAPITAQFMNK